MVNFVILFFNLILGFPIDANWRSIGVQLTSIEALQLSANWTLIVRQCKLNKNIQWLALLAPIRKLAPIISANWRQLALNWRQSIGANPLAPIIYWRKLAPMIGAYMSEPSIGANWRQFAIGWIFDWRQWIGANLQSGTFNRVEPSMDWRQSGWTFNLANPNYIYL